MVVGLHDKWIATELRHLNSKGKQHQARTWIVLEARWVLCHCYDILVHLWNGLTFFKLFKLYFLLGIDHNLLCFLCSHDLCLYLFSCFILHTITWPREVIIVLWSFQLQSTTILRMHPHPHSLLHSPHTHHPYTPCLHQSMMAPLGEEHPPVAKYGHPADLSCTWEDSHHSRLSTAKVKWVLPSRKSAQLGKWCCWEPSLD